MTAGKDYNSIIQVLREDFDGDEFQYTKFKRMLDNMPAEAFNCIWSEYRDKANQFSLCFVVESMAAVFATTGSH